MKLMLLFSLAVWFTVGMSAGFAGTEVYSTGFDSKEEVEGWREDAVWRVEKGVGIGGSDALVWTNGDPMNYDVQGRQIFGIRPGMMLRATFKVKAESLAGDTLGCTICWYSAKGWMGGAGGTEIKWGDRRLKPDADGWYQMSIKTPYLPIKMTKCHLQLYVNRGGTGRVLFDDVRVEVVGRKEFGGVGSIATSGYRGMVAAGDVRVVSGIEIPPEYDVPGKAVATLSYVGVDGTRKKTNMSILNADVAEAVVPVNEFAMGRHPISIELKGADGRFFGSREAYFERVREIPKRRVAFDEYGRTLVDGKPFFPIGMYWSPNTLSKSNALERYASAGAFNCLQTYEVAMTPEILDRYWAHGLRVVASVKDVYVPPDVPLEKGRRLGFTPPGVKTRADETNYMKRVVGRCRNHPALLAWYICDEIPVEFHDRLNDHYSLMKTLDPEHPAFVCICVPEASKIFLDSADVIGSDPYPVRDKSNVWVAGESAETIRNGMAGLLPMWQVPQAFSWRWEYPNRTYLHFPTFAEMRNMVWQQIAVGANGILLYSYGQILNCKEDDEAKERYFRISCDVAREVRNRIPMLLLKPGPKVVSKPERVRVRTWRDGAAAYALVCNTHPEPRKGTVRIEGDWTSGRIVFGEGAVFADDAIAIDMPSLGVAIVKLENGTR